MKNFNLRVYGLFIWKNQVLVSDERRGNVRMTKFPGGGLELGEGLAACLKREFQEELELDVEVGDFFYVNDFLQISAFNPADQLISFYYYVHYPYPEEIAVVQQLLPIEEGEQRFRWIELKNLDPELFNFPIDKKVASLLKQ